MFTLFIYDHLFPFRSPPRIPEVRIPEDPVLQIANSLRIEINRGFAILRDIASGRDLKKFLSVSAFDHINYNSIPAVSSVVCIIIIYLFIFNYVNLKNVGYRLILFKKCVPTTSNTR